MTRGQDNQTLIQQQKKQILDQDDQLDEIHGIVQSIKLEGQQFNDEVTLQNKMLDKVSDSLDKTQEKFEKSNARLAKLLRESNHCHLWCIIICEIIMIIILA